MASSSSSAGPRSSSYAEQHGYHPNPSPISYREHKFDYVASEQCACGNKPVRWIAWSNANPGRRYLTRDKSRVGSCKYFSWFDDPTTPFLRQLLVDLCDAVNNLRRENTQLSANNADLEPGSEERRIYNLPLQDAIHNMKQ
ncbi:hypothetical protein ZWY2020_033766 [Hordeum vulgare]|nr:hypothetical protein ZWY2020_033766 [Hordeum vulgare]